MATLELRRLEKSYGSTAVVRGVDLSVADNEFVVLVGPSGCGKSTILRMIAGLEEISSGEIRIDDLVVNERAPKDRDIAMVFQDYALYPHMTVADNMAFSLTYRGVARPEIARRLAEAAKVLDIAQLLHRYPRQLSGGQLQRVAIGRAVVRNARLYLFDEPLSNLDAQLRDEMRGEIKRLHQELGKTMIYVTHDQIEAMTLADRIVLMREGHIEQQGAPLDLFERPATKYVAGFLGSPAMNFIPGTLVSDSSGSAVRLPDNAVLAVPAGRFTDAQSNTGRPVILGIRPEHMSRRGVTRPGLADISAQVELVQPTGSRTYAEFKLGGVTVIAELEAHDVQRAGEQIDLSVDMNRAILIDPKTEKVI